MNLINRSVELIDVRRQTGGHSELYRSSAAFMLIDKIPTDSKRPRIGTRHAVFKEAIENMSYLPLGRKPLLENLWETSLASGRQRSLVTLLTSCLTASTLFCSLFNGNKSFGDL